jgi:hypothetical protein
MVAAERARASLTASFCPELLSFALSAHFGLEHPCQSVFIRD